MKIHFPDPQEADENGIVYMGGDLTEENILAAYERGIFPWPHDNLPMLWFCPEARGVLDFQHFHIPHSVSKNLRRKKYRLSFDETFDEVIHQCALQKRKGQKGTWVTDELMKGYCQLHRQGFAHSVECWQGTELVGGLYGVYVKGVFSGESMFFKDSGASKACLIALVEKLKSLGHNWFDIQMVTPVLDLFGGRYISRDEYMTRLKQQQKKKISWK
jgi:leucyl/phenylalanyl-tRNA---protein transferase